MPLTRKRFLGLAGRGALGAAACSTFGFLDRAEAALGSDGKPCERKPPHLPFRYRGAAVGVRGEITDPPHGRIPEQAAITLDERGGYKSTTLDDGFDFKGIVYVNAAYGLVTGNPDLKSCEPVFRTVVTSAVNGLDVDGVLRATSIVANLESQQPEKRGTAQEKEPWELVMVPVGYFDNLRIRGHRIGDLGPGDHLRSLAKAKKSEIDRDIVREVRETDQMMAREATEGDHGCRLGHVYHEGLGGEKYYCSIFSDKSIKTAVKGIPGLTACKGGRIHVDDLGDIYLGRLFVADDYRQLTMLRIEFNSPPTGWTDCASVEGDGKPS